MKHIFPLGIMVNAFAMTALLIIMGLSGNSALAADIGIVQGATLALFYAFSANARSLILTSARTITISSYSILMGRLWLLLPLSIVSYWLSVQVAGVEQTLAAILILRRCIEWLGEVHLSETERLGDERSGRKYFMMQFLLLFMAAAWVVIDLPYPFLGLFAWAALPLLFSLRFILKAATQAPRFSAGLLRKLLPHFGSSAIIGITVYVFRLLILVLVNKETAGDLFTAFAIGGLAGSIFANALGASMVLHEQRIGRRYFPPLLRRALFVSAILGVLIYMYAMLRLPFIELTGKSTFFWEATGLSLIGGTIMVYAQRIRLRILQMGEEAEVFGPDVMMNVLLISAIPFVFFLVGSEAITCLYLLSSILALIFYASAEREKN